MTSSFPILSRGLSAKRLASAARMSGRSGKAWSRNSRPWRLCEGMEKPRIRALRQAQLCGYLIDRTDRLYYPGGSHPLCSVQTAQEMVRAGWLVRRDGRYEITPAGLRVLELELPNGITRGP